MIRAFVVDNDRLRQVPDLLDVHEKVIWADLVAPTKEEEAAIEQWIGADIPTREEMEEIEISSRLYSENGAYFMTATLPANTDTDKQVMGPVTFVLARDRLVTVRYHEPRAFKTFPMRAESADLNCVNGQSILIALLEAIVDRLADLLERASREVIDISREIFHPTEKKASKRDVGFQIILRRIGREEHFISNVQDSLVSLQRVSGFLGSIGAANKDEKGLRARAKTLSRDVLLALYACRIAVAEDHLPARRNARHDQHRAERHHQDRSRLPRSSSCRRHWSPPIYGMNFEVMPELKWLLGYPFALGLMVVSAILPFWWFRRRGWL